MQGDNASTGLWEYRSLAEARLAFSAPLGRAAQPCLFDRIDWLEALHRHCMADSMPRILHLCEGAAQAWLFLAERTPGRGTAIANWYSFLWRPIFIGGGEAERLTLLTRMAKRLAATQARIDLYPVQDDALIARAFRRAGWRVVVRPYGGNHHLHLNGRDFAAYWAGRPGALRNLVRRKGRANRFACEIHAQVTDALWDDYVSVYLRSWKDGGDNYAFLRELAEREGRAGTLRLGFARENGAAVATQMWTVEKDAALIHKLAHDQTLDDASPGTLLSHHMFRAAIDGDGVRRIDYGTGDNPSKADWMEARRPLYRVDCFNPRFTSSWLPAIRAMSSALAGPRGRR